MFQHFRREVVKFELNAKDWVQRQSKLVKTKTKGKCCLNVID